MPATPATNRLRGVVVGAGAGALTVAAHGLGGGAFPDSAALAVLLLTATAVGWCAASLRAAGPATVLALLGVGQFAGHVTVGVLTGHQHDSATLGPLPMGAAHFAATLLCGVLILAAERLQSFVDAVSALVALRIAQSGYALRTQTFMVLSLIGGTSPSPICRRGPPVATA